MKKPSPLSTRLLYISVTLFILSLAFSVTNVLTVFSAPLRTVSVPSQVGFEGYLANAQGQPLNGTHMLTFRVYDVAQNGSPLPSGTPWTDVHSNVAVTNGLYSVLLNALPVSSFTGDRWLGVTVDSEQEISPRTRIASVPFALNAQNVAWTGITDMPSGFSDGVDNTNGGIGAGATGRVAVYDSASSVTGYSGLTYSASNLSVGGGLNVGSASGAAAGEIRTSSSLVPGTGTRIKAFQFTLANGANVQIVSDEAKPNAVVLVMNISDANAAQYYLRGGWNGVAEMSDYAGDFSPTSGNAGTTNIYYDTSTASYRLQNNNGTPMWYNVIVFDVL
jgi:hypothetical protein